MLVSSASGVELRRPADGDHSLRILDLDTLELELVSRKIKDEPLPYWDAIDANGFVKLPPPGDFKILINGEPADSPVMKTGFKRRPLYAPLGEHDLRIGTQIYLILARPLKLADGDRVSVALPEGLKSPPTAEFKTEFNANRHTPVIHINQIGYQLGFSKQAMAGYYLGDAGELPLKNAKMFYLRELKSGKKVFSAAVKQIRDVGFPYADRQYQHVLTLDFSSYDKPGRYTLGITGIGESHPFDISENLFACIARTYALGLYHQRSGVELKLPYTRFTHPPSHTRPVRIPTDNDQMANELVDGMAEEPHKEQKAPELRTYSDSLYPIQRKGTIDATGGHHDAGDYSKYTTNCAQLINQLMFAHDALPGVSKLDNLGLPESGDGIGDLMQIALHEAKFLAKLQDSDGGFFFLVYPEDRKYEDDIAPHEAGGQIVFPKNTASTAAATAALAQMGGSRSLQAIDKASASQFLRQAEQGWDFLVRAWEKHGRDGAYQRISHYGDIFMDKDEIVWAATELYLATKAEKYHNFLLENYKPGSDETRRWGWQRLFEGYGGAARSYAYAKMSGRAGPSDLDPEHLRACQQEVWGWGNDLMRYADKSAYGLSFPSESKAFKVAGWYFPTSDTLDVVAAAAQSQTGDLDGIVLSNMNYELGTNPLNICFLTGLGYKRPFEIVHQWARNDAYVLPMTGIPVGALVTGVPWIGTYERELGSSIYPPDGDPDSPYGFYDRITDTFNTAREFVTYQQGRSLAAAAYMMARTDLANQPYTHLNAKITGTPGRIGLSESVELTLEVSDAGLSLEDAVIVWEARGLEEPHIGATLTLLPKTSGPNWATVEAQWPDGRRAFARAEFAVTAGNAADPYKPTAETAFYFSGDSPSLKPGQKLRSGKAKTHHSGPLNLAVTGSPAIDDKNLLWMSQPEGGAIRFGKFEDSVEFKWNIPAASEFTISGWFYFEKLPHGVASANLFGIGRDTENQAISLQFDKWAKPIGPQLAVADQSTMDSAKAASFIQLNRWHKIALRISPTTWAMRVDGKEASSGTVADTERINSLFEGSSFSFSIGRFIGIADDLHVMAKRP